MPTSNEIRREIEIRLRLIDISKFQAEARRQRRELLTEKTKELLANPAPVASAIGAKWPPPAPTITVKAPTPKVPAAWPPKPPVSASYAPAWPPAGPTPIRVIPVPKRG